MQAMQSRRQDVLASRMGNGARISTSGVARCTISWGAVGCAAGRLRNVVEANIALIDLIFPNCVRVLLMMRKFILRVPNHGHKKGPPHIEVRDGPWADSFAPQQSGL